MELFDVDEYQVTKGVTVWIYKPVNEYETVGIHLYPDTGAIFYMHFSVVDGVSEECDYMFQLLCEVGELWLAPIQDIIKKFRIKINKNEDTWDDRWVSITIKNKKIYSNKEKK